MHTLTTARLTLRQWREADLAPFAAMNADPVATQFLSRRLSRVESDEFARRLQGQLAARGWGLWAVEHRTGGTFLGFVGLAAPGFEAHFTPCTEIAWRLAREHWGCGYATEAARECLRFAFETLALPEVVSFTALENVRSQAVMRRLGMRPHGAFDHPRLPPGHRLRSHVLYRLAQSDWPAAGA
ncbi:MAG TPA: GNAT family N-acetyltransferase [Steroidobacteraceae bacterium]|nr:GNAT family N-acetyltransferase [Steroidobacteraceae bacterium]